MECHINLSQEGSEVSPLRIDVIQTLHYSTGVPVTSTLMLLPMQSIEKEVCDELVHSLLEMGASSDVHSKLRQRVIRDCKAYLSSSGDPIDWQALKALKFPKNYNDAYEHVLRNDDVPDTVTTYKDKLKLDGYEPFYRNFDRRTGVFNGYKLKAEFKAVSPSQLDPFNRFTFDRTSKEETLFDDWFLADDDSRDGIMYEAVLACHALQAESCHNCKVKNVLRWNGGSGSSWQDLLCTMCEATYEIKTKATMEKVETALRYNNIKGGSFSAWCEMKNSKHRSQKTYLVLLTREPTFNRQNKQVRPVTIAEIEKVLPRVHAGSFNTERTCVSLKSRVSLNMNTKTKWFDLPVKGETIYMKEIAEKVYKDRFSEETFTRMWDLKSEVIAKLRKRKQKRKNQVMMVLMSSRESSRE
ncbi:hypothetical protein QTG54_001287 [Skeletonema marinoi]|uniref:Uncharacterized protein n=1 Tax=Skeletonema marinoi TaxID=267567 RepID=A0AAD8YIQ8_9STRA|nr:hypothetical protein QTG54_001287 [Skeletonema marinoi]